jgi:hypothetical protein
MSVHSDAKSVSIPVADMSALIARLEAAEAGSRELDTLICIALNYVGAHQNFTPENLRLADDADEDDSWLDYEVAGDDCTDTTPRLTDSLDAALALVERIWTEPKVSVWRDRQSAPGWSASVSIGQPYQSVFAPSASLALCISTLRAIQHGSEAAESGEVSPNLKAKAQGEGG